MYSTQKCSSNSSRRCCLLLIHYDMVIDLDEVVTISSVTQNICELHSAWFFDRKDLNHLVQINYFHVIMNVIRGRSYVVQLQGCKQLCSVDALDRRRSIWLYSEPV